MTEKNPRVSVIVLTHKQAHLVSQSIQSVLDRTYQDFEIIAVDDSSADMIEDGVKSFADDRINYIQHLEDKGGTSARNTGIKDAKGEFIAFLILIMNG